MAAGVRYVAMSPHIRTVLLRTAVFGFGASSILALLPLVAKHLVAGGPLTYGLLLGAFGAGAVTRRTQRRAIARQAVDRSHRPLGWLHTCARGCDRVCQHVPRAHDGRAAPRRRRLGAEPFDFQRLGAVVRAALGRRTRVVALSDGCIRRHGSRQLVVGRSCSGRRHHYRTPDLSEPSFWPACVLGRWAPLSQAGELNLDPLRTSMWNAPTTAVPVDARTGPVVITVEYIIDESDIEEFLGRMSERRRTRRRDGARNWRLLRDLCRSATVDRALRDADVARLHSSEQPTDAGRRVDSRALARAASRYRRTSGPPQDRATDELVADSGPRHRRSDDRSVSARRQCYRAHSAASSMRNPRTSASRSERSAPGFRMY